MRKKKIALFYDEGTESGRKILEFLMPFDKRKSDIVGELILLWIAEHGTNVPVQWLDRKRGEPGQVKPCFPARSAEAGMAKNTGNTESAVSEAALVDEKGGRSTVKENGSHGNSVPQNIEAAESPEAVRDESLIKAGLASFL